MFQEHSQINCKLAHNSHITENKLILQINGVNVNKSQAPTETIIFTFCI
jgi:hypothetical protein